MKTLVAVPLVLAALAGSASAQEAEPCPLSDGQAPIAAPAVTAQQIESGAGSLETFALSAARELRRGTHTLHLRCLFQQDGGPWHSGSTYLVSLTLDGRVFIHARDMSLSGRLLDPAIYRAVLGALGVGRGNDLVAHLTAVAAESGGGSFAVPGASGYATAYFSRAYGRPIVLLAGLDLGESHVVAFGDEEIEYGDPTITAADVVDRDTLKAFVTEAGEYARRLILTGDPTALAAARVAWRDPDGPWRRGPVYLYLWDLTTSTIVFHAGFPNTYEYQPLRPVARDAVTGQFILPQLLAALEAGGAEGGFLEYHFDDPADDTDSVDIPKVGYVREFTSELLRPDGSVVQIRLVVGSGFYQ